MALIPTFAWEFNTLSNFYTQPFRVNVFLGPVPPQISLEEGSTHPSLVASQYVAPIDHSLPIVNTEGFDRDNTEVIASHGSALADFDADVLQKATGEVAPITEAVKIALQSSSGTTAAQYLAKNLSWQAYSSRDNSTIDLNTVPIKVWITQVEWQGPIFHNQILWEATAGKPGALKRGESPAIEQVYADLYAMPEPDDDWSKSFDYGVE
jgi:hypothetical protein